MNTETAPPPEGDTPRRDAYAIDLSQAKQQPFAQQESEYRIVLDKSAHDDILAHAATNPNIELCGVLVGNLFYDDDGPYLHINHIIRGKEAREEASNVTFTHSTWEHIHKEMDAKHADARIVGWYHMHPGFGVFLSEVDVFAHTHFFNAAWQVALVVDPKGQSEGFFHWRGGEVVRSRRYWIGDELRWVPAQRPATSIPPGTSRSASPSAPAKPAPAANQVESNGDAYGFRDLLLIGLPIVACLLLLFLNVRGSLINAELAREVRDHQRRASEQRADIANTTALWLRGRLDAGVKPGKLKTLFAELNDLDPRRKDFYAKFLPELAGSVDDVKPGTGTEQKPEKTDDGKGQTTP